MARLRATASAARSVLDGREHGGTLGRVGEPIHRDPTIKKRTQTAIKNRDHAHLHGANNNLSKQTSLTEKGGIVNGVGDTPNMHDALTGSTPEGRTIAGDADMTCKNYTSSTAGSVMLGHSDRTGLNDNPPSKSWNASHPSRGPGGGCSQDDLKSTGGAGLYYCFATN
jgi:hypothetical protein